MFEVFKCKSQKVKEKTKEVTKQEKSSCCTVRNINIGFRVSISELEAKKFEFHFIFCSSLIASMIRFTSVG